MKWTGHVYAYGCKRHFRFSFKFHQAFLLLCNFSHIYQNGSAQKIQNTNKKQYKNTLTTHYVHSQSITIFTKCIDRIFVFTNKFMTSFFNI